MSDDGINAGSPDYEYEDDWEDESIFDLANDLAEHSTYSPVWQDATTAEELDPYYSDWEYYSDDYYDDDPNLLARGTLDGAQPGQSHGYQGLPQKRGRRRKLSGAEENSEANLQTRALAATIRGTVWAREKPDPTELYRTGENEKVSLLSNWRDLFAPQASSTMHHGKKKIGRDESWANDLGLADMGLHRPGTQHNFAGQVVNEADEIVEDEDETGVEDEDTADCGDVHPLNTTAAADVSKTSLSFQPNSRKRPRREGSVTEAISPLPGDIDVNDSQQPTKKRRKQVLQSAPVSREDMSLDIATNTVCNGDDLTNGNSASANSKASSSTRKRTRSIEASSGDPKRRPADDQPGLQQDQLLKSKVEKQDSEGTSSSPPRRSRRLKKQQF